MRENRHRQDKNEIKELLRKYQNLKAGQSHSFLDEESFERIIDYYDETENLSRQLRRFI
jgi:hypothetical protein